MASLVLHREPDLRDPVLVCAFRGWNDGGSAASLAATFLKSAVDAQPFATIDPDEYVDFQQIRPTVRLRDGITRELVWPETEFHYGALPGIDRDVVICLGVEPNLRWRAFTGEIAGLAQRLGVGLSVTLGGLLAGVPHTRPVPIAGSAHDAETVERYGLRRSRYEGPTGIVGALHDSLVKAHIPSVTVWAAVPHYIATAANPAAALALVGSLESFLDVELPKRELEQGSRSFLRRIDAVVAADDETSTYVRELERQADEDDGDAIDGEGGAELDDLPSGDDLADELLQYLRQRDDQEQDEG